MDKDISNGYIQQEINIQNIQRTHDATSVKQTKQFKNGQKTKVDKRRHTYGEQAHEKMLSIISHQTNVNQRLMIIAKTLCCTSKTNTVL